MDTIRKSKIRLRKNSFSAVIIPYINVIIKSLLSTRKICIAVVKEKPREKVGFVFEKVLDFLALLWYVVVLTGGATYEKYDKRAMARKHHSARGQQKQLKGNEGATRIHGKASRGLRENLQ